MIVLILVCAVLLSYVIDLSLWQGAVVVLFMGCVWITGLGTGMD